jgi:SEC-C motif
MAADLALVARYKHLRLVALHLHHRLVASLPKSAMDEAGKRLGILKGNVLTFDSEDEVAVLADFALYDVWQGGANAIERYLATSPPAPGSEEMVLLQAMRQARYSLFAVEAIEAGVGVQVRDLLRDEVLRLVDVSFSQSAAIGTVLAARVIAPEGIAMTTGAALPAGMLTPANRSKFLEGVAQIGQTMDIGHLSPERASELSGMLIRDCLRRGAAEHIRYNEPGQPVEPRHLSAGRPPARLGSGPPARRVGRNDRCPCGSGKKFKHCCGARR